MEKLQITQQELDQLHSNQESHNSLITQLGWLEYEKIKLKQREQELKQYLQQVQEESETLSQFLEQKYGRCSIDLSTGEITQID